MKKDNYGWTTMAVHQETKAAFKTAADSVGVSMNVLMLACAPLARQAMKRYYANKAKSVEGAK